MIDDDRDITPWRVRTSTIVLEDRWISVRADDCTTAEGVDVSPYYVLRYPDWTVIVAIDRDDRILFVEQYRHGLGIVSMELPSGGVDPGDAGALASARRELEEETGYRSDDWEHAITLAPNTATHSNRFHVFLARNAEPTGQRADEPTERLRLTHVPIATAAAWARNGHILQATHVAALAVVLGNLGRWG